MRGKKYVADMILKQTYVVQYINLVHEGRIRRVRFPVIVSLRSCLEKKRILLPYFDQFWYTYTDIEW